MHKNEDANNGWKYAKILIYQQPPVCHFCMVCEFLLYSPVITSAKKSQNFPHDLCETFSALYV